MGGWRGCRSSRGRPLILASVRTSGGRDELLQVEFVTSIAPIVRDREAARAFYQDALHLTFEGGEGDYVFTHRLGGVKHFGLWPLAEAARACFGTEEWPTDVPIPQASVEFEVLDVAGAADELKQRGHRLIHEARTEPWTQVTARLLSPEGLLIAVCYTPQFHADAEREADGG